MRDRTTDPGATGMLCAAGAAATLAAIGVGYLVLGIVGEAAPGHGHTVLAGSGVGQGSAGRAHHQGGVGRHLAPIITVTIPTTTT